MGHVTGIGSGDDDSWTIWAMITALGGPDIVIGLLADANLAAPEVVQEIRAARKPSNRDSPLDWDDILVNDSGQPVVLQLKKLPRAYSHAAKPGVLVQGEEIRVEAVAPASVEDEIAAKHVSYLLRMLLIYLAKQRMDRRLAPPALFPGKLTGTAVFLAGRKRSDLAIEWKDHLGGWTHTGLSRRAQLWTSVGFLCAAIRFRIEDAIDLAWQPVDAILRSRFLSGGFIVGPVIVMTMAIARHDGRFGLVAQIGSIGVLAAFLGRLIKAGREWRGVRPPEHRPRRARE